MASPTPTTYRVISPKPPDTTLQLVTHADMHIFMNTSVNIKQIIVKEENEKERKVRSFC